MAMAAQTPRDKTWWSLPGKPAKEGTSRSLGRESSSSRTGKLNSLASAFGLKSSKKPTSLAIQGPMPPVQRPQPPQNYGNRPSSKSVSTVTSNDSLGPCTPADKHRHSLLTLSDSDPFAAQSPGANDPTRLSVYSAVSMSDHIPRRNDDRSSASSSSLSFGAELPPRSPVKRPSNAARERKMSSAAHSEQTRSRNGSILEPPPEPLGLTKSGSSSTLHADKNRLSEPDPARLVSRPPNRARGNTDAGPSWPNGNTFAPLPPYATKPQSLVARARSHSNAPPVTRPRVVIRQPSTSRVGPSKNPPPRHKLPPPPSEDDPAHLTNLVFATASNSSSELSLASSSNDARRRTPLSPKGKQRASDLESTDACASPSYSSGLHFTAVGDASKTLRKAVSHHTFIQRSEPSTFVASSSEEKAPRKQRSFHHPRMPMPALPSLSYRHDSIEPGPRRGSTASTSQRKRLFSGPSTRRPHTAQEDDTRSVFSLPPERDHQHHGFSNPFASPETSLSSSFWEEMSSEHGSPATPVASVSEYTPQQIMSPADMLKVEASVMQIPDETTAHRMRSSSFASVQTTQSGAESFTQSLSPPPISPRLPMKRLGPIRSASMVGKSVAPSRVVRPSTAQATMSLVASSEYSSPLIGSLVPPRPRQQRMATTPQGPGNRMSVVPIFPLPPPPPLVRMRSKTPVGEKISVNTASPLRSVLKKPSFLNIEDEMDRPRHRPAVVTAIAPVQSSFLDFARESFDSSNSDREGHSGSS